MSEHKHRDEDLLIPESVAVRAANKVLGTDFSTVREIAKYLEAHPEKRLLFPWETLKPGAVD